MHSLASDNDKDPYEVKCHICAQCAPPGANRVVTSILHLQLQVVGFPIKCPQAPLAAFSRSAVRGLTKGLGAVHKWMMMVTILG